MREIKFRQPIFDTNGVFEKWHYCGLFDVGGNFEYTPPTERHYLEFSKLTDPLDSQQFTGLHDKNGKEIYEGDIVKYGDGKIIWAVSIGQIVFENAGFVFKSAMNNFYLGVEKVGNFEIIGNIHETPELLNNKQ